jgi:hypothetical protein
VPKQIPDDHNERRIFGEDIEEAEGRRVDDTVLITCRDQRDRAGHDAHNKL